MATAGADTDPAPGTDTGDAAALFARGRQAEQQGDAAAALALFQAAAAAAPADPWAPLHAAHALCRLDRFAAAEALYRRAATDTAARTQALLGLGTAALHRDDPAAALAHFTAAAAADSQDPWPPLHAADALRQLGRLDAAEGAYRRACATPPTRVRALLGLGACAEARADPRTALAQFEAAAAAAGPADPWPLLHAAHTLRALGRRADAAAALDRVLARHPQHDHALLLRGLLARDGGDREGAVAAFRRAAAWLELASEHRDQGDFAAARDLARRVCDADPANLQAWISLARSDRAAGQPEAALASLRHVIARDPDHADAIIEMAAITVQQGRPAAAAASLDALLAARPEHCRALEQRADMARLSRQLDLSLTLLRRAVAAHPAAPWPRIGLSQTLADLGRLDAALAELAAAQQQLAADAPARAALAAKQAELLRRAGHWHAALTLARRSGATWPHDPGVWMQWCAAELLLGEAGSIAACLAAAPQTTLAERVRAWQYRGHAAEAVWQLDAAAAHYARALAAAPDDAWLHMDMTRVSMLRLDIPVARTHARAMAAHVAGTALLQRRSPNVSQTHYGQILDEYELDPLLRTTLAALAGQAAEQRLTALPALIRRLPGATPAAVALLVALREAGWLSVPGAAAADGAAAAIPPRLAQYWDDAEPPADIAALMATWPAQHAGFALHRFDDAAAQAFLRDTATPAVLAAYRRAREPAQRADLFRLAWLHAGGGWYVDADNRCHAPLPTLAPGAATLVVYQEDLGTIGNDVIGATAGHPVIARALHDAVAAVNGGDTDLLWLATGPGLLTRAFAATAAEAPLPLRRWLAGHCVLDRRVLFRAVALHCAAGYKATPRHWSHAGARRDRGTPDRPAAAEPRRPEPILAASPIADGASYCWRDPTAMAAIPAAALAAPDGADGIVTEWPAEERVFLRHAPEFIDDPQGSDLFAHLGADVYRAFAPFLLAAARAAVVGYRTLLFDGTCCNDESYGAATAAQCDRLRSDDDFLNEETRLRGTADPDRFTLAIDGRGVRHLDGTVLVLCAQEPSNFGSFLFRTLPKLHAAATHGLGDLPVLVYAAHPAQRELLALCGVADNRIIHHDPGLITTMNRAVVPSLRNPHGLLDLESRSFYRALRARVGAIPGRRRLYVSRLSHARAGGTTRVMANEAELAARLAALGFDIIEPEHLPAATQIRLFAAADMVVGPAGSAMFNTVFCQPGTKVIDIESEPHWIYSHAGLFASCGLRYGVFVGAADAADPRPAHRRWQVDIPALLARIDRFARA